MNYLRKFSLGFLIRDGYFLFISSLTASGLNFALSVIFSRTLSIDDLGKYNLFFESVSILVMLSDIGITVTYINLYNIYKKKFGTGNIQEKILMQATLRTKGFIFIFSSIGILIYLPSVNFVDNLFSISFFLIVTAFSECIYQVTLIKYQAQMNFNDLAIARVVLPAGKILVCGAIALNWGNVDLVMLGYASATILSALFYIKAGSFSKEYAIEESFIAEKKTVYSEFFKMWRWAALTSFLIVISTKFSTFVLTTYASPAELVYYTTAQRFGTIGSVITTACSTILIPLAANATSKKEIKKYLKRSTLFSLAFSVPLVIIMFATPTLVPIIFGIKLAPSIYPTELIMFACLIGMLVSPLSYIFYCNGRAHLLTVSSLIQTLICVSIGYRVVAVGGAVAAAELNIYLSMAGAIIISAFFIKIYQSLSDDI